MSNEPTMAKDVRWISVEDELPKDEQRVLVYIPSAFMDHKIAIRKYYTNYAKTGIGWWIGGYQNYAVKDGYVTHWAELPKGPKL